MATLIQFGCMVSADKTWRNSKPRTLPTRALSWVSEAARLLGRVDLMSSSEGSAREQEFQAMPELSPCSLRDGCQRLRSLVGGWSLERTEDSSAGGRREFIMSLLCLSSVSALAWTSTEAAAAAAEDTTTEVPLEIYSDAKDGFALMRPAPWNKVDKPGAAIFFEDPEARSNNIGVTVAPVRIASLTGFGTVDDIVKKLVKAERDKPSTKDVQVIGVVERKLKDNTPLYALEYTLDTTRGSKRVLTSVTIAGYKLYILNIIFADGPVAPASQGLNDALHQVLNSFELLA